VSLVSIKWDTSRLSSLCAADGSLGVPGATMIWLEEEDTCYLSYLPYFSLPHTCWTRAGIKAI